MNTLYNKTYPLQMPMSSGTVTTPYDSRMVEKRVELQARIISRTKRHMKIRTKILRTPPVKVETPDYIVGLTVIATSAFLIAVCLSPLFLNFPTA
jgi:hypothetical protein